MKSLSFLSQRRFGPFFGVQFLGAFNDNLYKQSLIFAIGFQIVDQAKSGMMVSVAAGLFILPFMIFSPIAGQICDKMPKTALIRYIKFAEILIMMVAAYGLWMESLSIGLAALTLMGIQSTFFGPVKYSLIPQVLEEDELIAGNGLVEMGTFLAILLGTLAAGVTEAGSMAIAGFLLGIAGLGWAMSLLLPKIGPSDPDLIIDWNPFPETVRLYKLASEQRTILLSIMGISWFWYFGATILTILPTFSKYTLYGDKTVVTVLLAAFSISTGVGSILCEKLSGDEVELGLVPFGSFGMMFFSFDLAWQHYPIISDGLLSYGQWFAHPESPWVRVLIDVSGIGIFGAFFIVPLYALIQNRSEKKSRARIIAANNISNAAFMVVASLVIMALFSIGSTPNTIIAILGVTTAIISLYIFSVIPEFSLRFFIWILACTVYRLKYDGRSNLPRRGAAVLVCNHVSYIDWFIITAACNRPVRFVMYYKFFNVPVLRLFFKWTGMIPIAQAKESQVIKDQAFDMISETLRKGEIVCIFPEGTLTEDGNLLPFRGGVEKILERDNVPVIPIALCNLWGSFFSRKGGKAIAKIPRPSWRKIWLSVGQPLPSTTPITTLQQKVADLLPKDTQENG